MAHDFTNDIVTLRILINDMDETDYTYTDNQLTQIILVGANLIQTEINELDEYTITLDTLTPEYDITPEPDLLFTNLMILKAGCLISQGEYKEKSIMEGVKAVCGPIMLDVGLVSGALLKYMTEFGVCGLYKELKEKITFYDKVSNFDLKAILTPYVQYYYSNVCPGCNPRYGSL